MPNEVHNLDSPLLMLIPVQFSNICFSEILNWQGQCGRQETSTWWCSKAISSPKSPAFKGSEENVGWWRRHRTRRSLSWLHVSWCPKTQSQTGDSSIFTSEAAGQSSASAASARGHRHAATYDHGVYSQTSLRCCIAIQYKKHQSFLWLASRLRALHCFPGLLQCLVQEKAKPWTPTWLSEVGAAWWSFRDKRMNNQGCQVDPRISQKGYLWAKVSKSIK